MKRLFLLHFAGLIGVFLSSEKAVAQAPAAKAATPAPTARDFRKELEMTRETLGKYYETQKLLSKEKADWKLAHELLKDRIALMKGELEALKQKTKEEGEKITDADRQRDELVKQNDALKEVGQVQEEGVRELEKRTLALLPRLPEPLLAKIKPLADRIPKPGAETKQSLSERYQNVIGVLNETNKFNTDIVLATERRKLAEGVEAEVETLYFGLGQAYYAGAGATAQHAGVGRPGPTGFEWTPEPKAAPEIARAIGMQKNEQVPGYVGLPVQIK
jgi:FtsZ-binding cell division protein ZapB